MNITPIRPGEQPVVPEDSSKLASEMFSDLFDAVHSAKFKTMTVASVLGVLELLKHHIMTNHQGD